MLKYKVWQEVQNHCVQWVFPVLKNVSWYLLLLLNPHKPSHYLMFFTSSGEMVTKDLLGP